MHTHKCIYIHIICVYNHVSMKVHISDHFTYSKILRMTAFPIVMMVFISLYSIVDGVFIANFTEGGDAFAAVNLVFPFIMIIGSIGFMMGTGGTAYVSKLLGEKNHEKANKSFSLIVYATIALGVIFSIGGYFLIEPIVKAMASISIDATEKMISDAILYGKILISGQVVFMLQNVFQSFFLVAEKGKLGFLFTVSAGVTNMALDALLIAGLRMGVTGAAIATVMGYVVGGVGPLLYFIFKRDGIICLGKTNVDFKIIGRSAYNGMSEFIGNISMSVVSIVYNAQLLKAYGQNGIIAYGVIMYVSFVFLSIFIGYSLGMAPAVGYNYGAKNKEELHNILTKSMMVIGVSSIIMIIFSIVTAVPLSRLFSNGDDSLADLTLYAIRVYSIVYLVVGFSIYISSFFTALNNGTISAVCSISRTLIFQVAFAFILPLIFSSNSLWWAIVTGEIMSFLMCVGFLLINKKKYGY